MVSKLLTLQARDLILIPRNHVKKLRVIPVLGRQNQETAIACLASWIAELVSPVPVRNCFKQQGGVQCRKTFGGCPLCSICMCTCTPHVHTLLSSTYTQHNGSQPFAEYQYSWWQFLILFFILSFEPFAMHNHSIN